MSKSLGNSLLVPEVLKRVRGIELRYYMVSAHYRSHVEFSFEALEDAAKAFRRIEDFLERVPSEVEEALQRRHQTADLPEAFVAAMDDDLGTPAAVAVIHESIRDGNRLVTEGPSQELSEKFGEVVAMLDVLGLNPADPAWAITSGAGEEKLTGAIDVLIKAMLDDRAAAREDKDWGRADAIRDRIKAAGIEIEDTPSGPKWSI